MTEIHTALITVTAVCCGGLFGLMLHDRLPEEHVRDDSKDAVKTASGMIATLVALVIGLLVSSAKSSLDQANESLTQAGAKLIMLDQALGRYGPEAAPIREKMKASVQAAIERLWPSGRSYDGGIAAIERGTGLSETQKMIEHLAPTDEPRRASRTQALQICNDLAQSRWLLIEEAQTTLPTPFLVILIFWLAVLFTGLGLVAPRNATTVTCLFVCALSMAGAIFLFMEMNRPFDGLIQASKAPLVKALSVMGT
jgi:Protein of unknown function (DUF4239)